MRDARPQLNRRPLDFERGHVGGHNGRGGRGTAYCHYCYGEHEAGYLCGPLRRYLSDDPTPAGISVPVRHLLPGVTGELLARCHNDARAANRALHDAPHASRPPHQYEFKVGTRWRDTKDQQGFARRIVTVAGNHGHRITFLRPWLNTTFSLPRHVARHRMRRVEE